MSRKAQVTLEQFLPVRTATILTWKDQAFCLTCETPDQSDSLPIAEQVRFGSLKNGDRFRVDSRHVFIKQHNRFAVRADQHPEGREVYIKLSTEVTPIPYRYRMLGAPVTEPYRSPKQTAMDSTSAALGICITYDYIKYIGDSLHQNLQGETFIVAHYWVEAPFIQSLLADRPGWTSLPLAEIVHNNSLNFWAVDRLAANKVLQCD
jgi:hypothetical protein